MSSEVQTMASNLAAGSGARVHIGDDVGGVEGADFRLHRRLGVHG